MTRLTESALLAKLRVGQWTATRHDREATEEVHNSHKAEADAGKFQKLLVARSAFRPISQIVSKARRIHYTLTLPWDDEGARIMKATTYQEYASEMKMIKMQHEVAVQEFADMWPTHLKDARKRLGTLFNADEYPDVEYIKGKFYIDYDVDPVPEADDFRVKIGESEIRSLKKDLERRNKERLKQAARHVYERIHEVVDKMIARLNEYEPSMGGGGFRNSLVTNIKELAEVIPALNIGDDPELDKMSEMLVSQLCEFEPDELRYSEATREKVTKRAEKILKKASAYIA